MRTVLSQMITGVCIDCGVVRATQEHLVLAEQLEQADGNAVWLGLVADGSGSQPAGAYAGYVVGKSVAMLLRRLLVQPLKIPSYARLLRTAVAGANCCVFAQSQACAELRGMSSSLTAALVASGHVFIAQVGSSRAYKVAAMGRPAERLTTDHTKDQRMGETAMIASADLRPQMQGRYRSSGIYPIVDIDLTITSLAAGESILLCSQGLVNHVDDHEIAQAVHAAPTPQAACDQLVDLSNNRRGGNSTSVVLLRKDACGRFETD